MCTGCDGCCVFCLYCEASWSGGRIMASNRATEGSNPK